MTTYIVFDNEGKTPDRYTAVDRESGNVFSIGPEAGSGKFCGNCADHRVTLYGAGWRQMPLSRKVIEGETENYIHNAQLDPGWLGNELPEEQWPKDLLDSIGRLAKSNFADYRSTPIYSIYRAEK